MSDWPSVIVSVAGLGTTLGAVYLGAWLERTHRSAEIRQKEQYERNQRLRAEASDLMDVTERLTREIPHRVPTAEMASFTLRAAAFRARTLGTGLTPLLDEEIEIAELAMRNRPGISVAPGGVTEHRPISTELAITLRERAGQNHERLVLAMDDLGWPW